MSLPIYAFTVIKPNGRAHRVTLLWSTPGGTPGSSGAPGSGGTAGGSDYGGLSVTGVAASSIAVAGAALIGAGAALMIRRRRRFVA